MSPFYNIYTNPLYLRQYNKLNNLCEEGLRLLYFDNSAVAFVEICQVKMLN